MAKKNKKQTSKNDKLKKRRFWGRTLVASIIVAFVFVVVGIIYAINSGVNFVRAQFLTPSYTSSVLDIIDNELTIPDIVGAERVKLEVKPTSEPLPATEKDISDAKIKEYENAVVVGNSGYNYYKFDQGKAEYFTLALNNSISKISKNVNIYSMIVPSAVDIMLPLDFLYDYADNTSDQKKAIDYFNYYTNSRSKTIDIYAQFKAQCDEKIYFDSDNNWTSLGAYYAYGEFMYSTGKTPKKISNYEMQSAEGFLGSIYTYYNTSALSDPETIEYYVPKSHLSITNSGNQVFADVSKVSENEKYNLFLGGSRDITQIENNSLSSGKVLVVLGDTYGYSLAPYLAEEYKTTYFVDYRYYNDKLSEFVDNVGADDLLYLFGIETTINDSLISNID